MLTIGKVIPVGNFTFAGGDGFTIERDNMFPVDINNDGINELICYGVENGPFKTAADVVPSLVNIFGWQNGKLENTPEVFKTIIKNITLIKELVILERHIGCCKNWIINKYCYQD